MSLINLLGGLGLFGNVSDEDLSKAKLLDTHQFTENGITYEQKVYRLDDHTVYAVTKTVRDEAVEQLKKELERAISEQRFEDAAVLRDKLNSAK